MHSIEVLLEGKVFHISKRNSFFLRHFLSLLKGPALCGPDTLHVPMTGSDKRQCSRNTRAHINKTNGL